MTPKTQSTAQYDLKCITWLGIISKIDLQFLLRKYLDGKHTTHQTNCSGKYRAHKTKTRNQSRAGASKSERAKQTEQYVSSTERGSCYTVSAGLRSFQELYSQTCVPGIITESKSLRLQESTYGSRDVQGPIDRVRRQLSKYQESVIVQD